MKPTSKQPYETLESLIKDAKSVTRYLSEDSVGYHYWLMLKCLEEIDRQTKLEFKTESSKNGFNFVVRKKSLIQLNNQIKANNP